MERMKWKQYQEPLTTRVQTNHTVQSPAETAATAELPSATAAASTAATSVAPQIPVERQTSAEYRSIQDEQQHNDQPVEEQKIAQNRGVQQQKLFNDHADAKSAQSSPPPIYGRSNGTATDNNDSKHNLQYEQAHERTVEDGTNAAEQQQHKGNTQQSNCVEDSIEGKEERKVRAVAGE